VTPGKPICPGCGESGDRIPNMLSICSHDQLGDGVIGNISAPDEDVTVEAVVVAGDSDVVCDDAGDVNASALEDFATGSESSG
jgi:hypothetical protein